MRSHVTSQWKALRVYRNKFQYRKRYEVTCDSRRKFVEALCRAGFNTASGMRSHVTKRKKERLLSGTRFQYRKRYEVTCDNAL